MIPLNFIQDQYSSYVNGRIDTIPLRKPMMRGATFFIGGIGARKKGGGGGGGQFLPV